MEDSKPWIDVARLGQRIVHELDSHKNLSVLERWMSQRIAELISRTESSTDDVVRETAAKECEELILKLWSKRYSWPSGSPLSPIIPTLKRLFTEPDIYYRRSFNNDADKQGLISQLIKLHEREMRLFLDSPNITISEEVSDIAEDTLDTFLDYLTEDEIEALRFVIIPKLEEPVSGSSEEEADSSNHELQVEINKFKDSFEKIAKEREKLMNIALGIQSNDENDIIFPYTPFID